jgi:hypothetical protein
MNFRCLMALLAASLLASLGSARAAEAPSRDQDMVWLRSLERLRGEVVSMDAQGLVWRNSGISENLPLPLSSVIRVRLGPRPSSQPHQANPCVVRLINQDEIAGSLVGVDATELVVETWFAGALHIPRWGVASLQPIVTNPKVVYQGPNSMEEWTQGNAVIPGVLSNAWTYADGSLVANAPGSVARDVRMPAQASVDMDLNWSGYLSLAIALYADSLQPIQLLSKDEAPDFGGFYSLQINANVANLMVIKKGLPLNPVGPAYVQGLEMKTSTHLTIRTHKTDHTVFLFMDGVLIKQWQDPYAAVGTGTCIRIVNQGQRGLFLANAEADKASQVRVSNLVVSEWDGRQEAPANVIVPSTNDVVQMLNRDSLGGVVQEIHEGVVKVAGAMGPVTIPLERVSQIYFGRPAGKTAAALPGAIQAHFNRRGRVLLQPEGWEAGKLVAVHPVFGRAAFDLAAFRLLEWPE